MKHVPTDIDRHAAELLMRAAGVRAAYTRGDEPLRWGRFVLAGDRLMLYSERSGHPVVGAAVVAFDTDDGATQGALIEQVEQLATLDDIMDRWPDVTGDNRWMLIATVHETQDTFRDIFAPTLGALMVVAKRELKKAAP